MLQKDENMEMSGRIWEFMVNLSPDPNAFCYLGGSHRLRVRNIFRWNLLRIARSCSPGTGHLESSECVYCQYCDLDQPVIGRCLYYGSWKELFPWISSPRKKTEPYGRGAFGKYSANTVVHLVCFAMITTRQACRGDDALFWERASVPKEKAASSISPPTRCLSFVFWW